MQKILIGFGAALFASAGLAANAPAPGQPDISGVFRGVVNAFYGTGKTAEGKDVPLRPEARKLYEYRISLDKTEHPWADSAVLCLPEGMPRTSTSPAPFPFQILQTPGQVTIIYEALQQVRFIYLNRDHPDYVEKSWMGDSVGHWEGDTLVVDTIGINARSTIDKRGMPMSDEIHIVERIRKIDENTLENLVTIEDPKTFTKPWTARTLYQRQPPGTELIEFVCESHSIHVDEEGRQHFQKPTPVGSEE